MKNAKGHSMPSSSAGQASDAVLPTAGSSHHPHDPRRQALIASLRVRYSVAEQRRDAEAKRALFKEAAYLGIRPDAYQG
ncbi:MAG: hypothetical protein ER33_06995 [Cyanobium sp. CACIAM 14]|nr:MAG: hypothetical protein ER33_06995 [Cyanobium sp. CACIAM 14]